MAVRNRFHTGLDFISHTIFPRGCSSQAKALYSECSLALADQHQQVLSSLISHMLIRPFRQCGEGKTSGFFERDDPVIWLDWHVPGAPAQHTSPCPWNPRCQPRAQQRQMHYRGSLCEENQWTYRQFSTVKEDCEQKEVLQPWEIPKVRARSHLV